MTSWEWDWIASADGDRSPVHPALGGRFGPYEILELLGEGGMGRVYRARDGLGRDVALKLVKDRLEPSRLARFQREGQLASRVTHPGVLKVLAGGELGGTPFLVYELVEGARELDEAFAGAPLRERIRLLRDAARAVGQAHAQGIVHRDLKPANVLVDADGRVRVADFGLAKDGLGQRLTQTGALVGTPTHMAPEQLTAAHAEVGPPTDVWALGVILYEALCGQLPFQASSWTDLQVQVCRRDPPPPTKLDPQVPSDLVAVCERALRKDPGQRYPDAQALARDLDAWLAGSSGEAAQAQETARLRRTQLLAAVFVLIGSALAAAIVLRRDAPIPTPTPSATTPATPSPPEPSPAASDPAEDEAAAAWRRVEDEEDLALRLPAAYAWLSVHPTHPLASEARALLRRSEQPLLTLRHTAGNNVRVRFLAEDVLVTHCRYGIWRWRLPSGELVGQRWSTQEHTFVHASALLPGGDLVLDGEDDLLQRLPPGLDEPPRWSRKVDDLPIGMLAATRDGRYVVCRLTGSPGLRVLDVEDGEQVGVVTLSPGYKADCLVTDPRAGSRVFVLAGPQDRQGNLTHSQLLHVDVERQRILASRSLDGLVLSLAVAPAGDTLAVGSLAGEVRVLDGETFASRFTLEDPGVEGSFFAGGAHRCHVQALAYHPDGRRLLSVAGLEGQSVDPVSATTRRLKIWDLETRALLEARALPGAPMTLEVSPQGRLVAVGLEGGWAVVWVLDPP